MQTTDDPLPVARRDRSAYWWDMAAAALAWTLCAIGLVLLCSSCASTPRVEAAELRVDQAEQQLEQVQADPGSTLEQLEAATAELREALRELLEADLDAARTGADDWSDAAAGGAVGIASTALLALYRTLSRRRTVGQLEERLQQLEGERQVGGG